MKNIISIFYFLLFSIISYSQTVIDNGIIIQEEEIENSESLLEKSSSSDEDALSQPPNQTPTSIIDNLSTGTINKVTGKVSYTIPITEITTNRLTVGVNLSFNGSNAIKYADYSNKAKATGIVGLGWNINTSKIISDNKQTGYRDDDEFFLLEGGLKKLICTKKTASTLYEFKVENLPNWNVYYYRNDNYWIIVKDNGDRYFYGDSDTSVNTNANENIIRWKNWIGDSRATGGTLQTFAWNLSKISNQWDDKIQFFYETTDQAVQADNLGPKHTEASYLVRIESNSGEKIELNYLNKTNTSAIQEYYEPHIEINEPDAYQEQYEKKYLDNVILKRSDGQQLSKHQLEYEIYGSNLLAKRYLTQITLHNSANESLNPQRFEYNTDGEFKGTIYKIKNTTGSEVTYQYENKLLFKNTPMQYDIGEIDGLPSDHDPRSSSFLVNNNFYVDMQKSRAFAYAYLWNGNSVQGKKINFDVPLTGGYYQKFIGENYFGYIYNNTVELVFLNKDGYSWEQVKYELPIEKDPDKEWRQQLTYIAKDNYIIVISTQGTVIPIIYSGNNFILSEAIEFPDVDITQFTGKNDHFWAVTSGGTNVINNTYQNRNHYIISYQLDKTFYLETISPNPLNWYVSNLNNITREEEINLLDITLTTTQFSPKFYQNNIKSDDNKIYFFNGNQWTTGIDAYIYGNNKIRSRIWDPSTNINGYDQIGFFDPNFNTFSFLEKYPALRYNLREIGKYSINHTSIYKNSSSNQEFIENYSLDIDNPLNEDPHNYSHDFFIAKFARDKLLVGNRLSDEYWYFYIDQNDNLLGKNKLSLPTSRHAINVEYYLSNNYFLEVISGLDSQDVPFSGIKFYNLIENKIEQDIYDIRIKSIDIYDGADQHNIIEYKYNGFKTLNDGSTYYAEVISEKRGEGNSSLGAVSNYYNTGNMDIRKLGLLEKTIIKNTEEKIVKQSLTEMNVSPDMFVNNSENQPVFIGNRLIQNLKKTQNYFYENEQPKVITNQEEYQYNEKGLISKSKKTNSKGLLEEQNIEYAYENSNVFENANMINAVSKRISKVGNKTTWVALVEWANNNAKLYPNKEFSGPDENSLRLTSEITKISNKGVVEETSNGKGLYAANLSGYNYKRSVASIDNARFSEVIENLDVSYNQLQSLNNDQLKIELVKLYNRLPNAMIKLSFYDDNGNIISEIDARQEEIKYHYDNLNRLDYTTDSNDNVLKKNIYNYKTE